MLKGKNLKGAGQYIINVTRKNGAMMAKNVRSWSDSQILLTVYKPQTDVMILITLASSAGGQPVTGIRVHTCPNKETTASSFTQGQAVAPATIGSGDVRPTTGLRMAPAYKAGGAGVPVAPVDSDDGESNGEMGKIDTSNTPDSSIGKDILKDFWSGSSSGSSSDSSTSARELPENMARVNKPSQTATIILPGGNTGQPRTAATYSGEPTADFKGKGSGSIHVNMPAGGTTWCAGKSQAITWTAQGSMQKQMDILLLRKGSKPSFIAHNRQVIDKVYQWKVPMVTGQYRIGIAARDANGILIRAESPIFTISACGSAAAYIGDKKPSLASNQGSISHAGTQAGAATAKTAMVTPTRTGASLAANFVPGTVDIKGQTLMNATGGLSLSPDRHEVLARNIEAEIICPNNSIVTMASLTSTDRKSIAIDLSHYRASSRRVRFPGTPIVRDVMLSQLCPQHQITRGMNLFRPLIKVEWACESDNIIDVKSQPLGNYPVTLNCYMQGQ